MKTLSRQPLFLSLVLALACGCATSIKPPALGGLYNMSAMVHDEHRNPVIVIPGILGSKLVDPATGRQVWGAFAGNSINAATPEGARLCALPMAEGLPLSELKDEVVSAGALDRIKVSLLGLPVELNAYMNILATLGVGGYRDEQLGKAGAVDYGENHFTCFQFDYDWRRSNVENARRLHQFIGEKRAYVKEQLEKRYGQKNADVKFDIVAHSMGGLVARYYLQYGPVDLPEDGSLPTLNWAGAKYVDRLIMVGTPNAGSAKALDQLVNGLHLPTQARYEAAVLDTMPAIYELLPRVRHGAVVDAARPQEKIDFLDPAVWENMKWGVAHPGQARMLSYLIPEAKDPAERRRIALDHLRKCLARTRQFHAALDVPAEPPPGLEIDLIAGDAVPTRSVIKVDMRTGRFVGEERAPGDGTVIRTSALMDERVGRDWNRGLVTPIKFSNVMFLFSSHIGMTKDAAFADNVLYRLLEEPR
jgi:pimeloyl-ACP methyl ester carboxylesterase